MYNLSITCITYQLRILIACNNLSHLNPNYYCIDKSLNNIYNWIILEIFSSTYEYKHWRIQTGLFIKQISWRLSHLLDRHAMLFKSAIYDNPMTEITFSRFITRYNAITIYQPFRMYGSMIWIGPCYTILSWTFIDKIKKDLK